jgi:hypothetical protein
MHPIFVAVVILAFVSFEYGLAASYSCSKYDSNMGATFDLTDLSRWKI